jgi:hypothetical protein
MKEASAAGSFGASLNISATTIRAPVRTEFKDPDNRIMRSEVPGKTSVLLETCEIRVTDHADHKEPSFLSPNFASWTFTFAPDASLIALIVAPALPITPPTNLFPTRIFKEMAVSSPDPKL